MSILKIRVKNFKSYIGLSSRQWHLTSTGHPDHQAGFNGAYQLSPLNEQCMISKILSPLVLSLFIKQNIFFAGTYFTKVIRNWFGPEWTKYAKSKCLFCTFDFKERISMKQTVMKLHFDHVIFLCAMMDAYTTTIRMACIW